MKKLITFSFLLFSVIILSITIDDIKNLSKMPDTLENAWGEFVKYIAENPTDPSIGILGEVLSSKKYFFENYRNAPFLEPLIQENFNKFCSSLGLYNNSLNFEETQLLLKIFPQIPVTLKRIIETGIMELSSYKYLYKLEGIEKYISPFTYQGFLQIFIDKSIKSPVFLDKDMEKFVIKFIPKSKLKDINYILNNSTYFLDENNYLGAFKLLDFLKNQGIITPEELQTYSLLNKYFDLKSKIGQLSSNIYIINPDELEIFTLNILDITDEVLNLSIEKNTLYTLLTGIIKTVRIRIESSNKIIFKDIPEKISFLIDKSKDPLKSELIELKNIIDNSSLKNETIKSTETTKNSSEVENVNTLNNFYYFLFGIFIFFLIFIFFIPYFFPSHKSIEFYMKLKLHKIALKVSEKLLLKNPNDYKTYILMARILEELNEVEQAMMAYKMAHKKKQNQDLNL
ncbi:hypothetical protein [Marinitoga sp. 38H-ov]|uniref:tetratricopeptide repeat protein n=1 Tax=Marinitoga sp. 38H-ov TaxID=1755814 RepID=UPI0013EA4B81|nr:hypothetical protein [Marinitoga sp. 38H-ov]KAF2956420.1 hypothetical protein AS160_05810 [Marinitoga sp. 38H-ov]